MWLDQVNMMYSGKKIKLGLRSPIRACDVGSIGHFRLAGSLLRTHARGLEEVNPSWNIEPLANFRLLF